MHELLPTAGQVPVMEGDTRRDRVHEHGRGDRIELHEREAVMALARIPGRGIRIAPCHRQTGAEREGIERVAPSAGGRLHGGGQHRIRRGHFAAQDVTQRERLAGDGPPRAPRSLGPTANAALANASSGPRRTMTALSIARTDSKDADPMAGTPLNVERSMMSARCSAASGLPLKAWMRAAPKASPGWRSKRLVPEVRQPAFEPVAMTGMERSQCRLLDKARSGVNIATGEDVLDGQLRALRLRVPGRRSAVEVRFDSRLATLELGTQVVRAAGGGSATRPRGRRPR